MDIVNDLQTLQDARKWLRFFATEGMYRKLHAIEADGVMDVALRFEEMLERVKVTGLIQREPESEIEMIRRRA